MIAPLLPVADTTAGACVRPRRQLLTLSLGAAAVAALSSFLAGCGFGGGGPPNFSRSPGDVAYRRLAANHLYRRYAAQVVRGQLPPMLHAVGTVDVSLGSGGQVRGIHWRRRPDHAPEAIAAIEAMIRNASPFPAPGGLGSVYTETWLWTREGRFQLDSVTEGQKQDYD